MKHTVTVELTEDEYSCVQAQLENRKHILGEDVSENEYLANALSGHAALRETKQHYMNICEEYGDKIKSLERAIDIHYTNLFSMKNIWHWLRWKLFHKTVVGNYTR